LDYGVHKGSHRVAGRVVGSNQRAKSGVFVENANAERIVAVVLQCDLHVANDTIRLTDGQPSAARCNDLIINGLNYIGHINLRCGDRDDPLRTASFRGEPELYIFDSIDVD